MVESDNREEEPVVTEYTRPNKHCFKKPNFQVVRPQPFKWHGAGSVPAFNKCPDGDRSGIGYTLNSAFQPVLAEKHSYDEARFVPMVIKYNPEREENTQVTWCYSSGIDHSRAVAVSEVQRNFKSHIQREWAPKIEDISSRRRSSSDEEEKDAGDSYGRENTQNQNKFKMENAEEKRYDTATSPGKHFNSCMNYVTKEARIKTISPTLNDSQSIKEDLSRNISFSKESYFDEGNIRKIYSELYLQLPPDKASRDSNRDSSGCSSLSDEEYLCNEEGSPISMRSYQIVDSCFTPSPTASPIKKESYFGGDYATAVLLAEDEVFIRDGDSDTKDRTNSIADSDYVSPLSSPDTSCKDSTNSSPFYIDSEHYQFDNAEHTNKYRMELEERENGLDLSPSHTDNELNVLQMETEHKMTVDEDDDSSRSSNRYYRIQSNVSTPTVIKRCFLDVERGQNAEKYLTTESENVAKSPHIKMRNFSTVDKQASEDKYQKIFSTENAGDKIVSSQKRYTPKEVTVVHDLHFNGKALSACGTNVSQTITPGDNQDPGSLKINSVTFNTQSDRQRNREFGTELMNTKIYDKSCSEVQKSSPQESSLLETPKHLENPECLGSEVKFSQPLSPLKNKINSNLHSHDVHPHIRSLQEIRTNFGNRVTNGAVPFQRKSVVVEVRKENIPVRVNNERSTEFCDEVMVQDTPLFSAEDVALRGRVLVLLWVLLGERRLREVGYPVEPVHRILWRAVDVCCSVAGVKSAAAVPLNADHDCGPDMLCFRDHTHRFLEVCAPTREHWKQFGWASLTVDAVVRKIYDEELVQLLRHQTLPPDVQRAVLHLSQLDRKPMLLATGGSLRPQESDTRAIKPQAAVIVPTKKKRGRPAKISHKVDEGGRIERVMLWRFLLNLLEDPRNNSCIHWVQRDEGIFRILNTDWLARLWGRRHGNPRMTYEKMARAMRTYYRSKVLQPVPRLRNLPRKLVYKFNPAVIHKVAAMKLTCSTFSGRGLNYNTTK
ncbi:uncharacterized protein [Periplaneta americana]|uniref:uncharacterized protein n=1 Tax=Periplaneta americana TaxID=6978 RepID=UPI0037E75A9B